LLQKEFTRMMRRGSVDSLHEQAGGFKPNELQKSNREGDGEKEAGKGFAVAVTVQEKTTQLN
jgi:hypothetical protein